jgi:hypothetical protein
MMLSMRTPIPGKTLLLSLLLLVLSIACQEEEKPSPLKIDLSEAPPPPVDASVPDIPLEAPEIFEMLPQPPAPIVRTPGNSVASLRMERPNLTAPIGEDVLVEHLENGPFKSISYLLDPKKEKILAVSATFSDVYLHPIHREKLKENISLRLGNSTAIDTANYSGEKWATVDYRIELRRDKKTKEIELLFHQKGAETLERTRKGMVDPKSEK